jgi:hypothetical protein
VFKECLEDEGTLGSGSSARLDRRAFGDETRDATRRCNATRLNLFDGDNGEKDTTHALCGRDLRRYFQKRIFVTR